VPAFISLYAVSQWNKDVSSAAEAWRKSDPYVDRLMAVRAELDSATGAEDRKELKREIVELDGALTTLEREFALHLNNGTRLFARVLSAAHSMAAFILVLLAGLVSYRLMRLTGAVEDGRRQSEAVLRASEERYRVLFEQNLAAVFHSSRAQLVDCNEAMCRMLGYSREELHALDLRDLYCDQTAREAGQKKLYADGKLVNFAVDLRRKDGSRVSVLANLNLLPAEEGKPRVLGGVMIDVTDRKRAEEALRRSESEFRALFELANDGVFILGLDGRFLEVNDVACRRLG